MKRRSWWLSPGIPRRTHECHDWFESRSRKSPRFADTKADRRLNAPSRRESNRQAVDLHLRYSARRALIGSRLAARRAGSAHATSAIATNSTTIVRYVGTSV